MKLLRRIRFWLERRQNDGTPGPLECEWALRAGPIYSHRMNSTLSRRMLGFTLEEIAADTGVTGERVRQVIHKGCRMARNREDRRG